MDRRIRAFLAIAEEENLTAAAQRIGLAQPSLTKLLKRLESELGARLFDRLPRGMMLTPFGESFLERARRIASEYRHAAEEIAALRDGHLDVLRVGAGPLYHMLYIPRAFERLVREYPDTRLDLVAEINASALPKLAEGELDMVAGEVDPGERLYGVQQIVLAPAEIGIVSRRRNRLAGRSLSAQAISGRTWVVYQQDDKVLQHLNRFFLQRDLPLPRIAMLTSSFATGLRMVSRTDYLMTAPAQLAPVVENAELQVSVPEEPIWKFQTGVSMRRSSLRYPIVRRLLEVLRELTEIDGTKAQPGGSRSRRSATDPPPARPRRHASSASVGGN